MFTFRVTPDSGEPYTVTAGSRDVLHWEKTTKGKSFGTLTEAENFRMEDLYKLAWIASRRLSLFAGELKDFEAGHEVEPIGEEEPDPTPPAPSVTP